MPPPVAPATGLDFAFVDVASEAGYTLRNRTGRDQRKEFILEAMPPGVAVGDFDGDGDMDLFCPNGNDIRGYDRRTRKVTLIEGADAPEDELYWNEGGRFVAGGRRAGVNDTGWSFGAIAGDIDNDGDADLLLCNWGFNRLYLNQGDRTFREVAAAAGVTGAEDGWHTGACFLDYDKDGDLDIYVCRYADMHAYFEDTTQVTIDAEGLHGRSCDWKGLKVYCGPTGLRPQNDVMFKSLLRETGELRFEDVSAAMGIVFPYNERSNTASSAGPFYGFQPVSWDIDGDTWPDLFVANDSVPNLCWLNREGRAFTNRAPEMGLHVSQDDFSAQASMGVGVSDMNLDGVFDLIITEFSHDQFNLLLGERLPSGLVVFNEKASRTGLRDITFAKLGWGANFIDVDLDGDVDQFYACGHVYPEVDLPIFRNENTSYRQTNLLVLTHDARKLKIEDVSARAGPGLQVRKASRASVAIDFDDDGDMDIATTELNDTPCLLRCDVRAKDRHWLMVRLRGRPEAGIPLDPAGTIVRVRAGGLLMSRVLLLGSSFLSSEDPRLHFGLGPHGKADRVEVLWPDGKTTVLEDVPANRIVPVAYPP
jgi:hypothetical protein